MPRKETSLISQRNIVSVPEHESAAAPDSGIFSHSRWRRPATMAFVGWILREIAIFAFRTYRIPKLDSSFGFGFETGRIAASIATGHGFSSPFQPQTGPTAWLAPLYPYLLAGVFKLFGVYTRSSAIVILSINSVFSALTVVVLYYVARRTLGPRGALWTGWLASLVPYAWYWAVKWAWETSLASLVLACVFLVSLRMTGLNWIGKAKWEFAPERRASDWLLFGVLWGLIALLNPSLLVWLPFCGLWLLIAQLRAHHDSRIFLHAAGAALVFVALLCPWTIRNYRVFHRFIPIRGNFGVELRLGNTENALGTWRWWMHPTNNVLEMQKYEAMGEVAYVQMKQREGLEFIRAHPGMFLKLSLKRFVYFWYGVPRSGAEVTNEARYVAFLLSSILAFAGLWALWRLHSPATFLYASLLFSVPVLYYVTFPHARYRAPIEPEMLVLMVGVFFLSEPRKRGAVDSSE
ncbi:MAG: glycosyltransferase family 39 protein [Acidobacteria bacterium]|nr:glycosyltransferase family 39 protein [Acidobacteriota bacterium]MBV9435353.1 glycosyltransferase family 39 protein [Acidobacteriota bacterium]